MTSFFLFPFNPFNAAVNTKMILAVLGAAAFLLDKLNKREFTITRGFLVLFIISVVISVWAFLVTSIRNTADYSYATYFISVVVWISAAYFVVWLVRQIHQRINLRLICMYLVGVCVFQCVLAYWMTMNPALKHFIDTLLGGSYGAMGIIDGRLYGLGAALDPAGLRFAAVLLLCADLIVRTDFDKNPWTGLLIFLSFIVISVLGNMISRTTTVGMAIGMVYIIAYYLFTPGSMKKTGGIVRIIFPAVLAIILFGVWQYNVNPEFQKNIRFGFEGFFSLVEKGRWEVYSTNVLKTLVVWPETLMTWIIGDGYFMSPLDDPDRFGHVYTGYYMHTDIGYLRYIFYFGLIGLLGMILLFAQMSYLCAKAFESHKWVFITLFAINCIGWVKVSSDLIMVLTPFMVLASLQESISDKKGTGCHLPKKN